MKICMVGDNSFPLDEGMKKTTASLVNVVSKGFDTLVLNPLDAFSIRFWTSLIRFKPDVIHYVPGPSLKSFLLLWFMRAVTSAKTVMSVTHPDPDLPVRIASVFKPDLILTQSKRTETLFNSLGKKHAFLPNGVDTDCFRPVSKQEKAVLREKYGIQEDAFVILHVGNTRAIRNLDILKGLNENGMQVVVVSSTTIRGSEEVHESLRKAGCKIISDYVEHVEEIYQLSDFYLFPTVDHEGAIEHPLSVMEAMACNLFVGATNFGALPSIFKSEKGLFFYSSLDELRAIVKTCMQDANPPRTRDLVIPFSWDQIGSHLMNAYKNINAEG